MAGGAGQGGAEGAGEGLFSDVGANVGGGPKGENLADGDFGSLFGEGAGEASGIAESEIASQEIEVDALKQMAAEAPNEFEKSLWEAASREAASDLNPPTGEGDVDGRDGESMDQRTSELFEGSEQVDRDAAALLDGNGGERLDRQAEELVRSDDVDRQAAELLREWNGPEVDTTERPTEPPVETDLQPTPAAETEATTYEQRQAELHAEAERGWHETAAERAEFYDRAERELAEYRKNPDLYDERLKMSEAEFAEAVRDKTFVEKLKEGADRTWDAICDPRTREIAASRLISEYDKAVEDFFGRKRR